MLKLIFGFFGIFLMTNHVLGEQQSEELKYKRMCIREFEKKNYSNPRFYIEGCSFIRNRFAFSCGQKMAEKGFSPLWSDHIMACSWVVDRYSQEAVRAGLNWCETGLTPYLIWELARARSEDDVSCVKNVLRNYVSIPKGWISRYCY